MIPQPMACCVVDGLAHWPTQILHNPQLIVSWFPKFWWPYVAFRMVNLLFCVQEVFEGQNHWLYMEVAETFNVMIADFVKRTHRHLIRK